MLSSVENEREWGQDLSVLTKTFDSKDDLLLDETIDKLLSKIDDDIKCRKSDSNPNHKDKIELIIIFLEDLKTALLNLKTNHTKEHLGLVMEQQKEIYTALYSDNMGHEYEE